MCPSAGQCHGSGGCDTDKNIIKKEDILMNTVDLQHKKENIEGKK